jgi:hypothetical protein
VSGAGVTMCHLYDTHLQPPRLAFTLRLVKLFPVRYLAEGRTQDPAQTQSLQKDIKKETSFLESQPSVTIRLLRTHIAAVTFHPA